MKTTVLILMLASTALAGGNKELMTQAEADLREINKKVLKKVPADQIPENGHLHVKAKVKSTDPEPIITNLKVQTIESKPTTEEK